MENIIIIVLLLQLIMRQRIGYVLMLDIIIMLQEKAEKKKLQNMNGLFIILHLGKLRPRYVYIGARYWDLYYRKYSKTNATGICCF